MVVAQLLYLESEGAAPISMYINSPGGSVTAGMAIYDTMQVVRAACLSTFGLASMLGLTVQYIKPAVATMCMGQACSMASLLLAAGEKGEPLPTPARTQNAGHRAILPNARVMVHQPSGGAEVRTSFLHTGSPRPTLAHLTGYCQRHCNPSHGDPGGACPRQ